MLELFSWQLIFLLLFQHAVATVVKSIVPLKYREHARFKRIFMPAFLLTISIIFTLYVTAPVVLISNVQLIIYAFIVSSLQQQVFSAAKTLHPALDKFDMTIEETVGRSLSSIPPKLTSKPRSK
jgi:hypothetical protein